MSSIYGPDRSRGSIYTSLNTQATQLPGMPYQPPGPPGPHGPQGYPPPFQSTPGPPAFQYAQPQFQGGLPQYNNNIPQNGPVPFSGVTTQNNQIPDPSPPPEDSSTEEDIDPTDGFHIKNMLYQLIGKNTSFETLYWYNFFTAA